MNSTLNWALSQASKKLGISEEQTTLIYKSYWKFIRDTIHELELEKAPQREFERMTTNFNIPRIGKLYTNYEKIEKYKRKIKYIEDHVKVKGNQTSVQSGAGDRESV